MYFLPPLFLKDIEILVSVEAQLSLCSELSSQITNISQVYSALCTLYTRFLVANVHCECKINRHTTAKAHPTKNAINSGF